MTRAESFPSESRDRALALASELGLDEKMWYLRVLEESRTSAEELTETMFVRFWRDPRAFPPSRGPLSLQLIRRMTADLALSARG